jgi:ActR/RegA family two-component response regulator
MSYILVLDDDVYRARYFIERFGEHELSIAESVDMAIGYVTRLFFNYIFIDNDLGIEKNGTGLDFVEFLYNNPYNINNFSVLITHTWDFEAAEEMRLMIPHVKHAPFNTEIFYSLDLDI